MDIISERLNGLFKSVGKALDAKDKNVLQDLTKEQVKLGATMLDVNTGPGRDDTAGDLVWMVETIQEVTDTPLCIDTPKIDAMEAALEVVKGKVLINSTTAEAHKMEKLFPLAAKYNADIISLTLDERGIPNDAASRGEMAMIMITTAMEHGVPTENIYLDPLVLPVGAAQDQGPKVLEALDMFKTLCDPAPKTVVGLSNVSNNTKQRPLLNRTYLIMLMAHGLDAAICDPFDTELMNAIKTSEILLNKKLYADDFLRV
jgi:5-methyltetrahydrofolate corrinoid/iron sulfur protein methyltransferase